MEIAFTQSGDADEKSIAPRMDLALLIPWGSAAARLVFCEAKCADNAELSKTAAGEDSEGTPLVASQIAKYERFIRDPKNERVLIEAYVGVCRTLIEFRRQGWKRKLDPLIDEVAAKRVPLAIHPHIYLLVYGYDADQRNNGVKRKLAKLEKELGHRVIAKGDAKSFRLSDDILRREKDIPA